MEVIDIWCSAAIVLGICILPIIIILCIIEYKDNKEEHNYDKQHDDDDFDLRKYEYPDVPDLYYRSVVEEMNKIKDKPITINDLMNVNLSMIGMFEDYVIPNSKSDDKPNDTLGILK